jgi:hypothetical protein
MSRIGGPDEPAPRKARQNVLLSAEISQFGGIAKTKHRIRDLSAGGARIDRAGSLRIGATILVSVGQLEEVGATVIWVRGDLAGLKFANVIDPDAARSKTIVQAKGPPGISEQARSDPSGAATPSAGWIADLSNAYRK